MNGTRPNDGVVTYWEERLGRNFNFAGVGYMSLGRNYNAWLYKVQKRVFRRVLGRFPGLDVQLSSCDILDIGSGTGFYVDLWLQAGAGSVSGSDITSVAVGHLRKQYPGQDFRQLDISDDVLEMGERQYDIISAFNVLFHIIDDDRYVASYRNIYNLLRPGGLLIFSENLLTRARVKTNTQCSVRALR